MFGKKKKVHKKPVAMKVEFTPAQGDEYKQSFSLEFEIPTNGSYHIKYDDLSIYDDNGDLVRKTRMQAGFTISWIPIYWKEPVKIGEFLCSKK